MSPSGSECKINIKVWCFDGVDGPKLEEFQRPEERPGWSTFEGLMQYP
jgi:hypothetical protein